VNHRTADAELFPINSDDRQLCGHTDHIHGCVLQLLLIDDVLTCHHVLTL